MEECLWPRKRALPLVSICINTHIENGQALSSVIILSLSSLPSQFEFIVAGDISANSFINQLLDVKVTSDPLVCSVVQQSIQCMNGAEVLQWQWN